MQKTSPPDAALRSRTLVLVGMMGAGKTSVGKRLAQALDMPFHDADEEIERAAGRTITEIFEQRGEAEFRDGERRVIARLLEEPPHVLATGGGAFVNAETRALIGRKAISIWLKASPEVLARRVGRKKTRPLLNGKDPRQALEELLAAREGVYSQADLILESAEGPHQATVQAIIAALKRRLGGDGPMTTVSVGLGARSYDVLIGADLIERAGELTAPFLPRGRTAVVCDETVRRLHGDRLEASLRAHSIEPSWVVVAPGEQTKSWHGLADVCDRLLALGLDRGDVVMAFGGGVVGDLAGFAAAIYKRGIDFIQIPTTLLAQVDSSVGGKTAIDTPWGKKSIGAFHQPRLVLADMDVLKTLPARELRAGYAEVIKYGLLGDVAFFDWLEAHGGEVLALEPEPLAHAVGRCVAMKGEIVGEDEREAAGRALLNLGHTFGHSLESETGFGDALLHGEGVALGCAQAFRFSAMLGHCSQQDARRAEAAIAAAGLPTRLDQAPGAPFAADRLMAHMAQDKKAEGGKLTFVLVKGIGQAFVAKAVDAASVRAFLLAEGATP